MLQQQRLGLLGADPSYDVVEGDGAAVRRVEELARASQVLVADEGGDHFAGRVGGDERQVATRRDEPGDVAQGGGEVVAVLHHVVAQDEVPLPARLIQVTEHGREPGLALLGPGQQRL